MVEPLERLFLGGFLLFVLFLKKISGGGGNYLGLLHPISPLAMSSVLALSPERAVALLYVLLALAFVLFTTLTIVSLQRGESAMFPSLPSPSAGTIWGKTLEDGAKSGSELGLKAILHPVSSPGMDPE